MSTVKWGILSTAKIGIEKVIPGIQAAPNCEVVAMAGRDPGATQTCADQLEIRRAHSSYQDLLDDPAVEAVYIPLPNHLHAEWSIRAAHAGKHVLCEKPLALTSTDAQRMVDACAEADVKFMEAFMYRLHPSWQAVVELVRSGRIGDLVAVQSWFSYYNDDPNNIRNIREFGGGALMDIGCYPINLSRLLFDAEPDNVTGVITHDPDSGVDILTSGSLEFGDRTSTFTVSTRCEPDQRVHVYGTKGHISIDIPFNIPPDLPSQVRVTNGGNPPVAPATEVLTFEPADQYRIEAELFAAAILDETDVPIPPSDGVANMVVLEKLVEAAQRN